jgi:O-antigen ligase
MDKSNPLRKYGSIYLLVAYFIYAALFPSLRLLLLGSAASTGFWEIFFSLSPDILLTASFAACAMQYGDSLKWKNMNLSDRTLALYLAVSLGWGFYRSQDIVLSTQSIRLTYLPCLVYFVARTASNGNTRHEWRNAIEIIFSVQFCLCIIGLMLFFFFPGVVTYMMQRGHYFQSVYFFTRLTSILWNPVFFASVAAVASLYYMWKYLQTEKKRFLLFYLICFASMILTVSRGAYLSFIILYFVMLIWIFKGSKFIPVTLLSFSVFVLTIYLVTGGFDIVNWLLTSTFDTVTMEGHLSRVRLWTLSIHDFMNNPWGSGLGRAGHVAHRYLSSSDTAASIYSTDGWYLKLANETGIPGIILFLAFIYGYVSTFYKNKPHTTFQKFCYAIFLFVMLQNIVSNVLDFNYFTPLFWLIIGSTFSTVPADDKQTTG